MADHHRVAGARWRNTVMGLTPLIAVALFFYTRSWMWFLWIPVVGVLLYGTRIYRD